MSKKCKDFEISCRNSDAECFDSSSISKSELKLSKDNSLCEFCVYNEKNSKLTYDEWVNFRISNGLTPFK